MQGDDEGDDERDDARSGGRDRRRRGGDGCRCGAGDRLRRALPAGQVAAGRGRRRQRGGLRPAGRRAAASGPRRAAPAGAFLLATGDTRPALGAFQTALAGDPLDVVAQAGVATAQEQIGGPASAEAEWLRTWELSPGLAPVEARLQQAREAAGAPAMPAGREPYPFTTAAGPGLPQRGPQRARRGRGAGLLTRQPERADLHLTLAEAFWRAGDGASAGAQAEHLLERLPDCAANLLLAPAGRRWGAIRPLLSRVRAVDPAGDVATRLFGDREAPPPWTASRAPAGPSRPPRPARPPRWPARPRRPPGPGARGAARPREAPQPLLSRSLRWRRYHPRRQTAPDPGGAPGAPANARRRRCWPLRRRYGRRRRRRGSRRRRGPRGHQRPPNREPARPQRAGQRPGRRPRGGGRAGPPPAPPSTSAR